MFYVESIRFIDRFRICYGVVENILIIYNMFMIKNNDYNCSKIIVDRRMYMLLCRFSGKRELVEIFGICKFVFVFKSFFIKLEVENCNFFMNYFFLIIIYLK